MTTILSIGAAINLLNGLPLTVSTGVTVQLDSPQYLTPVVTLVRESVRFSFPQWLPLMIGIEAIETRVYPIVEAIAENQPVDIGGYWVDFHGQLPRITPKPLQSCLELTWPTEPRIDMRFVPSKLDPVIRSVTLFSNGAQVNGHGWQKWVEL